MTLFRQVIQQPAPAPDQSPPIAAFAADPETARMLDMVLVTEGYESAEVAVGRLSKVIKKYRALSPPPILIVDISESIDPVSELRELASLCPPNIQVFALGTLDSIDLYRRLKDIGLAEYLIKPVTPDQILDMLSGGSGGDLTSSAQKRQGKIVSVVGIRGGVGATSLSINIGWGLSQIFRRQTALVDVDLSGGSMALDLGVEPAPGFKDLIAESEGTDNILLAGSATPLAERLMFLAPDTAPLNDRSAKDAQATADIIRQISHQVSFTLLDLTHESMERISPLIEISDVRVLVMDRRLACLRDMSRLLKQLPESPDSRTFVVLNNPRPAGLSDFTSAQIAEVIGTDIKADIPYERQFLEHAGVSEKPTIVKRGAAARALRTLTADLAGIRRKRSRFSWFPSVRRRDDVW
ncbi:MAG: hypothetical protein NXI13_09450 [Proteobacteria bacterium]|nr:hypothetical protein [Pseudomonadota bacterium]